MGASNGSGVRTSVDANPAPADVAHVGVVEVDSPMTNLRLRTTP
jgi:hypothetical protein